MKRKQIWFTSLKKRAGNKSEANLVYKFENMQETRAAAYYLIQKKSCAQMQPPNMQELNLYLQSRNNMSKDMLVSVRPVGR